MFYDDVLTFNLLILLFADQISGGGNRTNKTRVKAQGFRAARETAQN